MQHLELSLQMLTAAQQLDCHICMQGCSKYALHPTSRLAYLNHQGECGARARNRYANLSNKLTICLLCAYCQLFTMITPPEANT